MVTGRHVVATCTAQHVRTAAEGTPNYIIAGRYEDEMVRTPDGWRISFRRLVVVWSDGNPDVVRPSRWENWADET